MDNKPISTSPEKGSFHIKTRLDYSLWGNADATVALQTLQDLQIERIKIEQDENWKKNNLEYDLRTTEWILEKVRGDTSYAQNLYAALCNTKWCKNDVVQILKEEFWSCSWRYAGGIIADMREQGDYVDWYCSGSTIRHADDPDYEGAGDMSDEQKHMMSQISRYVHEGEITGEIRDDLKLLNWVQVN